MIYLLDTDHISILQQQSGPEFASISARMASHSNADFAFSVVSFHEQVLGCNAYINRARNQAELVRGYKMLGRLLTDYSVSPVLPFDSPAAAVFYTLQAQRIRVGTMDLRIAAIALAVNLILLTRNSRHFSKIPRLIIEDWTS